MKRFVLKNKMTGEFYVAKGQCDVESPIDGLIMTNLLIASTLTKVQAGYELNVLEFDNLRTRVAVVDDVH